MSRVYVAVIPPGGWSYDQKGLPSPITAPTYRDLVRAVHDARVANKLPLGNPEADVEAYICERFPHFCGDVAQAELQSEVATEAVTSFREAVGSRAGNWYSRLGALGYVDSDESERRAKICNDCPNNTEWRDSCPCVSDIARTLTLVRKGQETETSVKGCSLFRHDNATAVWLDKSHLAYAKKKETEAPQACWLKNIWPAQ